MIDVRGRQMGNLNKLSDQLRAAGIAHPALGINVAGMLHTYDANGLWADLPPQAQAIVDAYVPDPPTQQPDFSAEIPADTSQANDQITQAITQLRAFLALQNPTQAQSNAALKLIIRMVFYVFKRMIVLP